MNKKMKTMLSIFIIVGIALLIFGFYNIYTDQIKTRNFISIEGTLVKSDVYSSSRESTTYRLIYLYIVDSKEYMIATDYGTSMVPPIGSSKTIKYNANNPSDAVIAGLGANGLLLMLGVMFTFLPIMILGSNNQNTSKENNKTKSMALGIFIGLTFTILGALTYYLIGSIGNSLSIIDVFDQTGLWIIIPIVFIIVGIYIILFSIFVPEKPMVFNTISNSNSSSSPTNIEDRLKLVTSHSLLNLIGPIQYIIMGGSFTIVCLSLVIRGDDLFTRLMLMPFLICGIAVLIKGVVGIMIGIVKSDSFNLNHDQDPRHVKRAQIKHKLKKTRYLAGKVYHMAFYIYWFGFLIVFNYYCFKQINEDGLGLFLFSLIFWAMGIYMAYKKFKR